MPQTQNNDSLPLWKHDRHSNTTIMGIADVDLHKLDKPIYAVLIHAAEFIETSDLTTGNQPQSVAHFRLFLQIKSSRNYSLELNSISTGGNLKTVLKVYHRSYGSSKNGQMGISEVPFVSTKLPTAREVVDLLLRKDRDRYELHKGTRSGCRYWCETVLKDFEIEKWVDKGSSKKVAKLASDLRENPEWTNVHMGPEDSPQGKFYS